ncbi:uncharacterized protein LOC134290632 [Aedes albopictus]|uniref:Integrase catalytic domain-containing protein n=1 Tax=Aedes albopictus TaxID=7160 RepID=A0ABM2A4W2_AEDAL
MPVKKASKASSATKLKLLHRRRSNILGSAMMVNEFNRTYEPARQNQLATQIALLDELWRDFLSTQEEIEILEDSEEHFSEERRDFQLLYLDLKGSLQSKLPTVPPVPPAQPRAPSSVCALPAQPITNVRLPEMKIPNFGGKIDDWVPFRDLFVSLIHFNQQLTAVQKMHYLRASLTDEAARIVSTLDISADDYQVAWNLLKDRFENPNLLIKRHMSALLAISPIKKESASGLSELADSFDRHVQLLNKLETVEEHWNSFLVERLSSCLDHGSLREWETHLDDGQRPTYKQLVDFIHKRSRIITTLMLSHTTSTQSESKPSKPRLTAHVASENVKKCPHCKQAHLLFQCSGFQSLVPQQRFEFVKKHGLCINCLKGAHLAKDCSSGSCKQCSKKHHSLLHLPPISSASAPGAPAAVPNQSVPVAIGQSAEAIGSRSYQVSPRDANAAVRPPSAISGASPLANSSFRTFPQSYSVGIPPTTPSVDSLAETNSPPSTSCQSAEVTQHSRQNTVVLSTAVIKVKDADNNDHFARALLDSGSQPSFISESLCQKLRLKRFKINSPVSGIGQSTVNVHFGVTLSLASRFGDHHFTLDCLVLPKLTVSLPSHHINVSRWQIPRNLPMADPQFNISQKIDIIIGAELFFSLLEHQQISLAAGCPLLQKTVLGYIVCGKISDPALDPPAVQTSHICTDDLLDKQLERFWEIDNFDVGRSYTPDEQRCEDHFQQTVGRDTDGRYIVRLPLREDMLPMLGDSYQLAFRRLQSMEKKFAVDEGLRIAYHEFLEEYESLGHMEEVNPRASRNPQFFLPHHAIHRPESSTTKTRVVFDGSCRSSTSLSLNEVLFVGPTVQPALYSTVINIRLPRYAVTADAEKMFRQIWVHPDDRKYQQILFRKDPSEPVRIYQLKTVTYGLASSPFHATRVLNQLATDEGERFPLAVPVIKKGTYVDDVLAGDDDQVKLAETCRQLMEMLHQAGFVLRKWATNNTAVLASVPRLLWETKPELEIDRSPTVKTLGLLWFPQPDTFQFKIPALSPLDVATKRLVVSEMSQLFDPLGLLGPVVMKAKTFVQVLWAEHWSWDDQLSEEHSSWWTIYRSELNQLQALSVPRRVVQNRHYSLHCFCDASKAAYGCCIYVVSRDELGQSHSHLLTAKSRVAPLRGQSIPRLELCAALLGSQLADNLRQTTDFVEPPTFWVDSSIVLHWIKSQSNVWKVFVSNRIAEIQRLTKDCKWRHVPSEMNPADRISRGMMASQISKDDLWWHGPSFLKDPVDSWPECVVSMPDLPDLQQEACPVLALHSATVDATLCERFTDLSKLIRVVARCYRFFNNSRLPRSDRTIGSLTPEESEHALKILVRQVQLASFPAEVHHYRSAQSIPSVSATSKSPLKDLKLFMDQFGLLRLCGRLANMKAPYDTRYPILLPADHRLSWLIARSSHIRTLHGGPTLTLATIRQRFWPVRGRQLARKVVRQCVTCFRCQPRLQQQLMAPLPSVRVSPARPFIHSGMDYCGPFLVRPLSGRGASVKIYVGLFVCLVVKAVHLEVVADLSSAACINAVKRFVARRGRVLELHCDNATAFVGADRELRSMREEFRRQFRSKDWENFCVESGIKFRFIPARSPHFGGIWEAGIKSFKHHFRRIMGNRSFTVDQLQTVVAQIESVLNSRPLSPLTDSPDDCSALTPGHFLVGEPLVAIPEPDLVDVNPNRLSRLQEMKKSVQDLWRCWQLDYVSQLQQRTKWKRPQPDVRIGQLVLVRQATAPPLQWPLGRIIETVAGKNGRVRVVVVKTASGQYKRAVTEIAVLPIAPAEDEPKDDSIAVSTSRSHEAEDDG